MKPQIVPDIPPQVQQTIGFSYCFPLSPCPLSVQQPHQDKSLAVQHFLTVFQSPSLPINRRERPKNPTSARRKLIISGVRNKGQLRVAVDEGLLKGGVSRLAFKVANILVVCRCQPVAKESNHRFLESRECSWNAGGKGAAGKYVTGGSKYRILYGGNFLPVEL